MKRWALVLALAACEDDDDFGNIPQCGDGVAEFGEPCDDGNFTSGDGCDSMCREEPVCGDGILSPAIDLESCDDGNLVDGDGCDSMCQLEDPTGDVQLTVSWQIRNFEGATQACPTGYDTVAVYSQLVQDNPTSPIVDLFDCAAGSGTTRKLFRGRYKVFIGIVNTSATQTYARSTTTEVELLDDAAIATAIYTDAGYFAIAWNLVGASSTYPLTCSQAGADGIELVATLSGSSTVHSDIWECEDRNGLTGPIPIGTYTVSAGAINAAQEAIGTAPAMTNQQIMGPNKVTDLGTVWIPIDGL